MTTVVTRAYKNLDTARKVADALRDAGLSPKGFDVFSKGEADLEAKLAAAKVEPGSVAAFAKAVAAGNPVVVGRAEITPFGAAARAKEVVASFDPVEVPDAKGDHYVSTVPISAATATATSAGSIDDRHGLIMSSDMLPGRQTQWRISDSFGWKLLSDRKPAETLVMKGKRFMSQSFWPAPLLSSRKPAAGAVKTDHPHMSKGFWPAPLLSSRKPAPGVVKTDHPHMSKGFWPAPLLSERR